MKVSKEVADLAKQLIDDEPDWKKHDRPSLDEVEEINIINDYVEVYYERELYKEEKHTSGTQELVIAFFPHVYEYEGLFMLDKSPAVFDTYGEDKISDEMQQVYELFTAVIGRLTYHGKS
jgi:hypothetical protein